MRCVLRCASLWVARRTSCWERSFCPRTSSELLLWASLPSRRKKWYRLLEAMEQLAELEAAIKADADLRQRIVRSIGSSSVALFALVDDHGKHLLELAGSGTLVIFKVVHY